MEKKNGVIPTEIVKRENGLPPVEGVPTLVDEKSPVQNIERGFDISPYFKTAGQLKLTEAQKKTLFAPVDKTMIEIRPDGIIYLPFAEYRKRLIDAFGMEWSMIPQSQAKATNNYVIWEFWLIVQGKLIGFAMGGQEYFPNSKGMKWDDAVEAAKSNALMRLCKGIGITSELWIPSFIKKWIADNAERHWCCKKDNPKDKKFIYIKKGESIQYPYVKVSDSTSTQKSEKPDTNAEPKPDPYPHLDEPEDRIIYKSEFLAMLELCKVKNVDDKEFKKWLKKEYKFDGHRNKLPYSVYQLVIPILKAGKSKPPKQKEKVPEAPVGSPIPTEERLKLLDTLKTVCLSANRDSETESKNWFGKKIEHLTNEQVQELSVRINNLGADNL